MPDKDASTPRVFLSRHDHTQEPSKHTNYSREINRRLCYEIREEIAEWDYGEYEGLHPLPKSAPSAPPKRPRQLTPLRHLARRLRRRRNALAGRRSNRCRHSRNRSLSRSRS
ncbi:hypothetical protein CERZMDRAFT_121408 [Cercospora zeae-maydis SCOH1-5]|uniref:Uncharacterized protein n=1 Tax=Cercospora zeae-maydis SCOH1-5 TaxID=717836 RepID=A0A6A6FE69_9PEZI|nr:hypothetical protein CERZMDRAFT_121408 [Cercospora zeae-maydis SCOH1-5]